MAGRNRVTQSMTHQVTLPAGILFKAGMVTPKQLDPEVMRSIDLEGWLPKHPAKLVLFKGSAPRIGDGNHRLSYLAQTDRLDMMVPVEVCGVWYV